MKGDRPVVMITGFYGAGNSGDEAMLRNFVKNIRYRLPDSIIYVGANRFGTWRMEDVYYVSALDRGKLVKTDLFVVGGGDLGIGFGWNLLGFAKLHKAKIVMMSMSLNDAWIQDSVKDLASAILKSCDLIYVRDQDSVKNAEYLGAKATAMTDMAIDIPSDSNIVFNKSAKHCTICVREVGHDDVPKMVGYATHIINKVIESGFTISLLPFCTGDKVITDLITENFFNNTQIVYSIDPQQHKYLISKSEYLVSIGRLHPLIYAAGVTTPMIGVTYPHINGYHKIQAWMKYINMGDYCIDFKDDVKTFDAKWTEMRNNRGNLVEKLAKQKIEHLKTNNQQFDNVVKLISKKEK